MLFNRFSAAEGRNRLVAAAIAVAGLVFAGGTVLALDDGTARTPPMGWNNWYATMCTPEFNDQMIYLNAAAMVTRKNSVTGKTMKDVGFRYINIDDCWALPRNSQGVIQVDAVRFPKGMKYVADSLHKLGLLFGTYTDLGHYTCEGRPGTHTYETIDAQTYAGWGVDFIKADWCNSTGLVSTVKYPLFRNALKTAYQAAKRPFLFSICEWGSTQPWLWADTVGHMFRATYDNQKTWNRTIQMLAEMAGSVNGAGPIKYTKPGSWADADIMMAGLTLTDNENTANFGMWSIIASPLLLGCRLNEIPQKTVDLFTNEDIIAVNQDPLGQAGRVISVTGTIQNGTSVWTKPLRDGTIAIALLNTTTAAASITFNWSTIKWTRYKTRTDEVIVSNALPALIYKVVNLLTKAEQSNVTTPSFSIQVPSHGIQMFRVYPAQVKTIIASPAAVSRAISVKRTGSGYVLSLSNAFGPFTVRLSTLSGRMIGSYKSADGSVFINRELMPKGLAVVTLMQNDIVRGVVKVQSF